MKRKSGKKIDARVSIVKYGETPFERKVLLKVFQRYFPCMTTLWKLFNTFGWIVAACLIGFCTKLQKYTPFVNQLVRNVKNETLLLLCKSGIRHRLDRATSDCKVVFLRGYCIKLLEVRANSMKPNMKRWWMAEGSAAYV